TETLFVGYDQLECDARIVKYRGVTAKGKQRYQIVLDKTPFYAESGGQVGDTGWLTAKHPDDTVTAGSDTASGSAAGASAADQIVILDTRKENNLIVHLAEKLPADPGAVFSASSDPSKRRDTANNHTATHLLHAALRETLGDHVQQKGS